MDNDPPLIKPWGKFDKKNCKNSSTRARSASLAPLTPDKSIGCDINTSVNATSKMFIATSELTLDHVSWKTK